MAREMRARWSDVAGGCVSGGLQLILELQIRLDKKNSMVTLVSRKNVSIRELSRIYETVKKTSK